METTTQAPGKESTAQETLELDGLDLEILHEACDLYLTKILTRGRDPLPEEIGMIDRLRFLKTKFAELQK